MKVILKQDHHGLGKLGEIVEVKSGYARNFLLPQSIASLATPQSMRIFEQEKKKAELQQLKEKQEAEDLAKKLESVSITATVNVGEDDKVFGSVTAQNISELLEAKGYEFDKRKILLEEPLKALGVYEVGIKLHTSVDAKVKVWVVKE